MPAAVLEKLAELDAQYAQIERELADPAVMGDHRRVRDLSIKRAALEPTMDGYRRLMALSREAEELRGVLGGASDSGEDAEFAAMAREELPPVEPLIASARKGDTTISRVCGLYELVRISRRSRSLSAAWLSAGRPENDSAPSWAAQAFRSHSDSR